VCTAQCRLRVFRLHQSSIIASRGRPLAPLFSPPNRDSSSVFFSILILNWTQTQFESSSAEASLFSCYLKRPSGLGQIVKSFSRRELLRIIFGWKKKPDNQLKRLYIISHILANFKELSSKLWPSWVLGNWPWTCSEMGAANLSASGSEEEPTSERHSSFKGWNFPIFQFQSSYLIRYV
jgi:hypothetical protein